MDWQDISTAPKDGTWIMALVPESVQDDRLPSPFVFTTKWVKEVVYQWEQVDRDTQKRVMQDWSHWYGHEDPSHWMPLPPPPTEAP